MAEKKAFDKSLAFGLSYMMSGSAKESEEQAKKQQANQEYISHANDVVNYIIDTYEEPFSEIDNNLSTYYISYNIDDLDLIRKQYNQTISNLVFAVNNCSDMIDECEYDTFSRLNRLIDNVNNLRTKIESAKKFVPDQFMFGQFMIIKKGSSYYLSLPDSFSDAILTIPATCRFAYSDINISGLENLDLSHFNNLKSIEYEGTPLQFDVKLHNSCPHLETIVFSNSDTQTPIMINGNSLREDISINVSQKAIVSFCSSNGWSNHLIVAKGAGSDLYAQNGIIYKYDKLHSEVSLHHYYDNGSSQPILLPSINNSPITVIEDSAFENSKIDNIIIPSTVTTIGDNAFYQCINLHTITIPTNVVSIGRNAFQYCTNLNDIIFEGEEAPSTYINSFPSNCWISVASSSFDSYIEREPWSSLNRVREIGEETYRASDGLQVYIINESNHSANLLKGANESQLSLSNHVFNGEFSLSGISSRAFDGCDKLTALTIPASVSTIEPEAFYGAPNLTTVYSLNEVPANCEAPIFERKNACIVYVPKDAIKLYRKQKGWRSANKIVPFETTNGMISSSTQKKTDQSIPFSSSFSSRESEPMHVLFGVDALIHNSVISEMGAIMSIGGHSNTLNFEVGLNVIGVIDNRDERIRINFVNSDGSLSYSFFARPKINLIKKDYNGPYDVAFRKGTDYSSLYLYIAPEAYYFGNLQSSQDDFLNYVDYGIRAGLGFGIIDFSLGYLFKLQTISFGISLYLSNK